jgi:hypothetical protein
MENDELQQDIAGLEKEYKEKCDNLIFDNVTTYMKLHKEKEAEAMVLHDKLFLLKQKQKELEERKSSD